MAKPSKKAIVHALLERHGRLYSEEIGACVAKNSPAALFQWLVASILFSAQARLGDDAEKVARLVDEDELARLAAALVRVDFAEDEEEVVAAARRRS